MSRIEISFLFDEAYLREFHTQWVAVSGPGWRMMRRIGIVATVAAAIMGAIGWRTDRASAWYAAIALSAFGGLTLYRLLRQRDAWLTRARLLPEFGKRLRAEVRDGWLVQVRDDDTRSTNRRFATLVTTPRGYFARWAQSMPHVHDAISTTTASVYIPHRSIVPPMTREAFLGELSKARVEGRDEEALLRADT